MIFAPDNSFLVFNIYVFIKASLTKVDFKAHRNCMILVRIKMCILTTNVFIFANKAEIRHIKRTKRKIAI